MRPEYLKWFEEMAFLLPPELKPSPAQIAVLDRSPDPSPATDPASPPPPPDASTVRFDLAALPTGPAFTTWAGNISHGTQRSETVIFSARTLGTAFMIDDKEYRWIEVTSTSAMEGQTGLLGRGTAAC